MWRDVRYACRLFAKNPGFTIVAVLSLAIGIGANSAVFSFADALILRPLTVPRPTEVLTAGSSNGFAALVASYREYVDIRDRNKSFEGLVAYTQATVGFSTRTDDVPKLSLGMLASSNLFSVMGVELELGRGFRPDENQVPGRDTVAILGHDFWQREFGADPHVLGRRILLNAVEFTIVGVAPKYFAGIEQYQNFDFYAPLMMWPRLSGDTEARPLEARDYRWVIIKGRLKPGVTLTKAQSELSVIGQDLERAYPDTNRNRKLIVRSELQARMTKNPVSVPLVAMLTLLATAVLLVACGNVAGLLMSRAPIRAREIALRLAIGAGRPRVIRQLITESVLIGALGGVMSLGVSYLAVSMFRRFRLPIDVGSQPLFELDTRAMMVGLIATMASVVLFGLAPAIRSARTDLTSAMKATDAAGYGRRRRWGRAFLVGGQVATSVILLVLATFIYRGFRELTDNGPGYRTDHLLIMSFNPSLVRRSEAQAQQFFAQVAERARQVPGVRSAAVASSIPMDLNGPGFVAVLPEGFQFPVGTESGAVPAASIGEGYFDTIGVPVLDGREFRTTDAADAPRVAVVNERFAARYWPGQSAIGKRFRLTDRQGPWVEIVGVARNSKYFWLAEQPGEFLYLPYRQQPQPRMTLLTESSGDPAALAAPLREMVRGLDVGEPIFDVRTMAEYLQMRMLTLFNVIIGLIASLGLMGLSLALVGLYGLVAYAVSRRTREIGIRMAIGADRSDILRMAVGQGATPALAGLLVGILVSAGVGTLAKWSIPGGSNPRGFDLTALVAVAAAVLAVALLAAYLPARRAARINPTEALRYE